jgi:hypothetical protein
MEGFYKPLASDRGFPLGSLPSRTTISCLILKEKRMKKPKVLYVIFDSMFAVQGTFTNKKEAFKQYRYWMKLAESDQYASRCSKPFKFTVDANQEWHFFNGAFGRGR